MSLKKFLCITLVLALLVLSLSGCGGSSHSSSFSGSNDTTTEEQQQETQDQQEQQDTTDENTNDNNNNNNNGGDNNNNNNDTNNNNGGDNNTNNNGGGDNNTGTDTGDDSDGYDTDTGTTINTSPAANEHAIVANATTKSFTTATTITKTGDYTGSSSSEVNTSASTEDADFYGFNAAILAKNSATLTIKNFTITTNGKYANAIFSYGSGTTVNVSDTTITTSSSNSGGIMTTGGGTMNASDLTITTSGGSSAAIRSDRGGGDVNVDGGTYTTSGTGSPAIYCTADISVSGADLESKASQGVVIEGSNSVTLDQCNLTANHTTLNGQDSSHQGVMIYQSGSGDASSGTGTFTMKDSSFINQKGALFFVTNTTANISLTDVDITNNDSDNIFLNAASAAWGTSGSNGGSVTLTASGQTINGSMTIDSISSLTLSLKDSSTMNSAINTDNTGAEINVTIESGSTWTLTGNSYITSLSGEGTIDENGYTLYVNGTAY